MALVIGNAAYREAPLLNPVNDARAVASNLRRLGFAVIERENASREQMTRGILEFSQRARQSRAALFYYAGHGMQVRGKNYLIPVDADIVSEGAAQFASVDVGSVLAEMEQAGAPVNIVILDACRNNPFERRLRGGPRGLAAIDAARGSLIAYATAPGSVASDGDGANGVYTAALLHALSMPGLKAEEMFKRVRVEVTEKTGNRQTPWESSSLTGDFVFNPAAPLPVASASAALADREALFWDSIKDSDRADDLADYLARYPQGEFAGIARRRIEALRPPRTENPQPAPGQGQLALAPPALSAILSPPGDHPPARDGGVKGASPFNGRWEGRFVRNDPNLGTGNACKSSRSEFQIVDGRIVDGFIRLDDGRQFDFKNPKRGRVEFEGAIANDGNMNVKMRMFDNFGTNFMNIRYAGLVQQDAAAGDWRDDFGHCRGTFTLRRKH